jgi:hypothetical protein
MSSSISLHGPRATAASPRVPLAPVLCAGLASPVGSLASSGPIPLRLRGPGWAERLAAWAERQPAHRRLGHWTAF